MTVLIVEDDDNVRTLLVEALTDEGYDVVAVADGVAALTALQGAATRPRLVLLDLMLPHMNGWQFLDVRARDPTLRAIPVVVLSAHPDVTRLQAMHVVADAIRKPVDLDTLLAVVQQYCTA